MTAGVSPSGKAAGFDPAIRRFESFHPSQLFGRSYAPGFCSNFYELPEEREEIRLPVGRMETTVYRQVHTIDKEGVLTCEKRNDACDFIRCGGPADREAVTKS